MSMGRRSRDEWQRKLKCSGETQPQCHFTNHKSHMDRSWIDRGPFLVKKACLYMFELWHAVSSFSWIIYPVCGRVIQKTLPLSGLKWNSLNWNKKIERASAVNSFHVEQFPCMYKIRAFEHVLAILSWVFRSKEGHNLPYGPYFIAFFWNLSPFIRPSVNSRDCIPRCCYFAVSSVQDIL